MSDGNVKVETAPQQAVVEERASAEQTSERLFREQLRASTPAPDFTLQDVAGLPVSLSDYKGKRHVVLEFGAIT